MARISPFCGFMTTVTPWLTSAVFMPHSRAFVASRCMSASIVSIRFVPGTGSRTVSITLSEPPGGVALHQLGAELAAQLLLERSLDARLADDIVAKVAARHRAPRGRRVRRARCTRAHERAAARWQHRSRRGSCASARPRPRPRGVPRTPRRGSAPPGERLPAGWGRGHRVSRRRHRAASGAGRRRRR